MQETGTLIALFAICVGLLAILIAFIAFISFLYQKRQHAFFQQLQAVKSTYEREGLKSQLEVQEQTLQHISMEIHDNIGQFMSLAKLHLNTLELPPGSEDAEKLHYAVELIGKAMDDLRDISKSVSLELIQKAGLVEAIENQVNQLRKTARYEITFVVTGRHDELEEQKEIILFRILQESVNNIVRHAQATRVDIALNCTRSEISLFITDDGKGFDPDKYWATLRRGSHGGISHMIARASLIDAQFSIVSAPGQGTRIQVTVPYTQPKEDEDE